MKLRAFLCALCAALIVPLGIPAAASEPMTKRVSVDSTGAEGNNATVNPAISADGRFVAFSSLASNVVAGDTNGVFDVFVGDRNPGSTERVSVNSSGGQANDQSDAGNSHAVAIGGDGRFVAFGSRASNLVPGDTNGVFDARRDQVPDRSGTLARGRATIAATRIRIAKTIPQAVYTAVSTDGLFTPSKHANEYGRAHESQSQIA